MSQCLRAGAVRCENGKGCPSFVRTVAGAGELSVVRPRFVL